SDVVGGDVLRTKVKPQSKTRESRTPGQARPTGSPGQFHCLSEHRVGVLESARVDEGEAKIGQQIEPPGILRWEQSGCTAEQVGRRRHVALGERLAPGGGETVGGRTSKDMILLVDQPKLMPVAVGLLEVVANDFLMLCRLLAELFQPHGELLVEPGAKLF